MLKNNLTDILSFQAKNNPEKIAIFTENKNITFLELENYVNKLSSYFVTKNIKEGNIIIYSFKDELLTAISMLASAKIGATFINVSIDINKFQLQDIIDISKASFFVIDIEQNFDLPLNIIYITQQILEMTEIEINNNIYVKSPNSPWQIIIGSGTTGKQKLFPISHKQEKARIELVIKGLNINNEDRMASLGELTFATTKTRFLAIIFMSASYIFLNNNIQNILPSHNKFYPTILCGTVFHIESILNKLSSNSKNVFIFLRVLLIASSTITTDLRKRIQSKLTSNLYIGYGTNEVGFIVASIPQDTFKTSQIVGKAIKGVEIQIVDENDKEKPLGEIGHIRVKSPGMIEGYLNDEEATSKAFRNGWFYPGDLGKLTEDKELIYCGRSDYMMIMNGINIYPAQIENVLTSHEFVKDAVAFPIKHEIHQNIPICAVVLKNNYQISKKDLMDYCIERLGFSSPKEIIFLDFIPRNEQGKVIRSELINKIMKIYK